MWPYDWHIYIWPWPIPKVKVAHISTMNILKMVTDSAHITNAIRYEVACGLFDWRLRFNLGLKDNLAVGTVWRKIFWSSRLKFYINIKCTTLSLKFYYYYLAIPVHYFHCWRSDTPEWIRRAKQMHVTNLPMVGTRWNRELWTQFVGDQSHSTSLDQRDRT